MIELTRDGGLWMVTINNPDKANALTEAMLTIDALIRARGEESELAAEPVTRVIFGVSHDRQDPPATSDVRVH